MKICVIGAGHVGLVTGVCFADLGHEVVCVDRDRAKLKALRRGEPWFYEPGLAPMLVRNMKRRKLSFTESVAEAVRRSQVIFIAVGTPPLPTGDADLSAVEQVVREIARAADGYRLIVEKSTVPVETGKRVQQALQLIPGKKGTLDVASNPEFLREGSAVEDFLHPERIVIGVESKRARILLEELYQGFGAPLVITDIASAELIKHASNAFLSTKISFVNALSVICDRVGADVEKVALGMGMDSRIGPSFLRAGVGYGGFCLSGSQTVLVREEDQPPYRISLRELSTRMERGPRPLRVLSVDPRTYRAAFARIRLVSRRRYEGRMLAIRTKMNKAVRVTEDHPLLVHQDGKLVTRLAREIRPGDLLPSFLSYPDGFRPHTLDLIETLEQRAVPFRGHVRVRLAKGVLQKHREGVAAGLRESGRYDAGRLRDIARNDCLLLDEYLAVEARLPRGTRACAQLFTSRGRTTTVPALWRFDQRLCRFLGYYAAEGHIHHEAGKRGVRSRVVFHFHEEEKGYIADVAAALTRLGIRHDLRPMSQFHTVRITCSSRLLAFLLDEVLGCGQNSYDADVPDLLFGQPPRFREAFLRAVYRGDGSVHFPRGTPAVVYDFGTVSPALAQGVTLLLHSIGIVPSGKVSRSRKSTMDAHFRRISGIGQIRRFPWAGEPELRRSIARRLRRYRRHIRPTGYRVAQGAEGQVALTKVVKVTSTSAVEDVYSLEVEGTETFVTDEGLIVHNCFPKDLEAFIRIAERLGYDFKLLKATQEINEEQKRIFLEKISSLLWNLKGKKVGVLGLAFKPETDDLRFAPALDIIASLLQAGAKVKAYDPQAMRGAREILGNRIQYAKDEYDAARGADCLLIVTEWKQFKEMDLKRIRQGMHLPVIVDGRNLLSPEQARQLGFRYVGMGRG